MASRTRTPYSQTHTDTVLSVKSKTGPLQWWTEQAACCFMWSTQGISLLGFLLTPLGFFSPCVYFIASCIPAIMCLFSYSRDLRLAHVFCQPWWVSTGLMTWLYNAPSNLDWKRTWFEMKGFFYLNYLDFWLWFLEMLSCEHITAIYLKLDTTFEMHYWF